MEVDRVQIVRASQNGDGGWPYRQGGTSWTEPTAYGLLALMAGGSARGGAMGAVAKGLRWLAAGQGTDGGWTPQRAVHETSWVTAIVALLGPAALGEDAFRRAIGCIVRQTGEETTLGGRIQRFLTGVAQGDAGWPWFPGTSAWVTPTSLGMLALRKALPCKASTDTARMGARIEQGAAYLQRHACRDGGWNHGAARALDFDARSYPETTGIALLALSGRDTPEIRRACAWARAQLPGCRSSEGESWLRLGLLAHGQLPPDVPPAARTPRTVPNSALALLASAAAEGRNLFLMKSECPA